MSIKVMSLVWEKSRHKGSDLLLLVALADIGDDEGKRIYPSIAYLCRKTRLSERGVQTSLKRLCVSGEISIAVNGHARSGGAATNEFTINLSKLGEGVQTLHPRKVCTLPPQNLRPPPAESAPNPLVDPLGESLVDVDDGAAAQNESQHAQVDVDGEVLRKWRVRDGYRFLAEDCEYGGQIAAQVVGAYGDNPAFWKGLRGVNEPRAAWVRRAMVDDILKAIGVENTRRAQMRQRVVMHLADRADAIELIGAEWGRIGHSRKRLGLMIERLLAVPRTGGEVSDDVIAYRVAKMGQAMLEGAAT
jgi:hypothetical protein